MLYTNIYSAYLGDGHNYSMVEFNTNEKTLNITAGLEALLFVASEPISKSQISEALDIKPKEVEKALEELELAYKEESRGLRLQRFAGKFQIITAPEYASIIEKFLGLEATTKLSRAALEALAIVAYRQPATRPAIDAIRGVNSDGVIRSLLNKGLVEEAGRAETPGRPILYQTTMDFLCHFGLSSLEELPSLEPVESQRTNHILKD